MVHGPRALEVARLAALLPLIIMTSMGHCRVVVEFPIGEDAPTDAAIKVAHAARDLQAIPVIARGQKAPCGRYPYVVSLQTRTGSHKCGGFLVNRYWVITAAHCVDDDSFLGPSPIVVIGACSLKDKRETVNENGEVEVVLTERTVVHENFTGDVTNGNDIAMLKLLSPSMHHPASLPMTSHIADGLEDVATIGWGLQEDGTSPVDLRQQSHVRIVPNKFCDSKDSWGSLIQDTMLCAFGFGSEQDTCQGDSGGPLFEFSSREGDISKGVPMEDVVIGITSFGEEGNCGRSELPAVFTRLSSYREWIDQKMGAVPVESSLPPPLSPSVPPPPSLPAQPPSPPLMQPMPPTEQAEIGSDVVPSSEPGEVEVLVTPTVLPEGCVCTLNGLSGSTPTRRAGCHSGAPGGVPLCYVKDKPLCEGALGRDSELFPGAYWIVCEGPRSVQAFARHGDKTSEEQLHLNQELVDLVPAKENATMRAQIRGLILDGANPNADFRSSTVLHLAAERGYLEVAVLLIEAGADIHAEDQLGATPLEEAAAFGHPDVADLLISLGANTDHRNNEGRRPWDAICFFVTCDMEQEAELRALLA